MATLAQSLPALTTGLYRLKFGFHGLGTIALSKSIRAVANETTQADLPKPLLITANATMPPWLNPAVTALQNTLQLPENWDGYGAACVKERIVQRALMLLLEVMENDSPVPNIVPLEDGGIQLEWHRQGKHLEVELPTDERPGFFYYEDQTGVEEEERVSRNYDRLNELLRKLD